MIVAVGMCFSFQRSAKSRNMSLIRKAAGIPARTRRDPVWYEQHD